jgi:hypothetical protein
MKAKKTVLLRSGVRWASDEFCIELSEWKTEKVDHYLLEAVLHQDIDLDPDFEDTKVLLPSKYNMAQAVSYTIDYLNIALQLIVQSGTDRQKERALAHQRRLEQAHNDVCENLPQFLKNWLGEEIEL